MRTASSAVIVALLGGADAFALSAAPATSVARRAAVYAVEAPPPAGFVWADADGDSEPAAPAEAPAPAKAVAKKEAPAKKAKKAKKPSASMSLTADDDAVAAPVDAANTDAPAEGEPRVRAAYYCNDEGCWVGQQVFCDETSCWIEEGPAPVVLPDGRAFTFETGTESHKKMDVRKASDPKVKKAPEGIFAPAVVATADLVGRKELNQFRAKVIAEHTKVIGAFVDTSDSKFGRIALKAMFEAADKDGNGTLDKEEVREALYALGFTFIDNKTLDKVMNRADTDGNEVIDFEEFVKETPKTLRSSLVKLAKTNGHDLGFLA